MQSVGLQDDMHTQKMDVHNINTSSEGRASATTAEATHSFHTAATSSIMKTHRHPMMRLRETLHPLFPSDPVVIYDDMVE